ncbi:PIG-L deacetylase family protein [Dactylosporangium matsuzakiense]|uniref:GlcNAc-PI de-N-acetylase n=1 Tax=Dactylosporangium matsuzakiense TaxID=53360 RepID=A0A9W6KGY6_9ACTN|nr:PIG-L deacetylase family protein [Dactylosporangium matsuzakiense]UWZ42541.1 PIG-L family deacetylase [Dactylosporangium matsuzakiense]GLL00540.1 GlcNAc-PI de-N-acetylase [Dactylosporangium matsuzakiense]
MKVMTIYAHPADTITNCGGTLARHADAGDEIVALILTHGGRIHANRYAQEWRKDAPDTAIASAGLDEIIAFKKGELERAAEIVGISRLVTLDRDDREAGLHEGLVETVAEHIAAERPDVIICDYPQNPVMAANTHTVATTTVLAALGRAGAYLRNLDGQAEYHVKQVFLTSLPVFPIDGLSLYGVRNDVFVDITPVVGRKVAAMDCFDSQGYSGLFARKLIESANGEAGRAAGVNFAEGYYRLYNETHATLPLTDAARAADPLVRHVDYSRINLREEYPLP